MWFYNQFKFNLDHIQPSYYIMGGIKNYMQREIILVSNLLNPLFKETEIKKSPSRTEKNQDKYLYKK